MSCGDLWVDCIPSPASPALSPPYSAAKEYQLNPILNFLENGELNPERNQRRVVAIEYRCASSSFRFREFPCHGSLQLLDS